MVLGRYLVIGYLEEPRCYMQCCSEEEGPQARSQLRPFNSSVEGSYYWPSSKDVDTCRTMQRVSKDTF